MSIFNPPVSRQRPTTRSLPAATAPVATSKETTNATAPPDPAPAPAPPQAAPVTTRIAKDTPFSPEEDAKLIELKEAGKTWKEIMEIMNRTAKSELQNRFKEIGSKVTEEMKMGEEKHKRAEENRADELARAAKAAEAKAKDLAKAAKAAEAEAKVAQAKVEGSAKVAKASEAKVLKEGEKEKKAGWTSLLSR